jgi:hypothetical protein
MAVTSYKDIPNYDQWGIDEYWSCSDWIEWHKKLKAHFGKDKAKYIWEYAYSKGTLGASHLDCRTFNTSFREYAKKNDLNTYESAGILGGVLNIGGSVFDIVDNIGDAISGIATGIGKAGKIFKVAVPLIVVGAGIYFGVRAYQNLKNPDLQIRRADARVRRKAEAAKILAGGIKP